MKKIISKKIEMSAMFVFAFVLSFTSVSFVLADNSSSEDSSLSSSGEKIEYKGVPGRQERFDSEKRVLGQKSREEMGESILKMKEIKNRLENRLEKGEARFGSSTVGIGDPTSSTTPFRKMEMERMKEGGEIRNGKEMKNRFDGRLDERRAEFGTSTVSTITLRKMELERMKKESVKIAERFTDNLKRLEDFYRRISEKVGKFENKAVSVDETKSLLGIARLKINSAKSDVDNLMKTVKEGVGNQNKNDYLALVKNLSIKAKNSIHEAQKALSNAVSSLKPGLNKNKSSSSSAVSSVSSSTASSATSSSSSSL